MDVAYDSKPIIFERLKYTGAHREALVWLHHFSPLVRGEDIFENTDECKTFS